MTLRNQFTDSLKIAMKNHQTIDISTIRLILAALKEKDIEARAKGNLQGIPENEITDLLQKMIKQRRESVSLYEQGNRPELAQKEKNEITILEKFLPQQLDGQAIKNAIEEAIKATGAQSIKDMGKLISFLKEKHAGQMDFAQAASYIKEKLT
ncbi:MAG: GatB/YqeY domain-containing protein [Alphaproteobacteria bacterium]|nr:GatB/YqeY domain-containing protein [Alphaproteobacteria bacterium]